MSKRINDILRDKIIGISISDSEDLTQLGFGKAHLVDAKIEIARHFLSSGMRLMYGGDLRNDGFTQLLFELVESYTLDEEREYLINYLAWPLERTLTEKLQASLSERIKFVKPGLPKDIDRKLKPNAYSRPDDPQKYYVWSRSLTAMRESMIEENDARIVLGGKTGGFKGKYPGVIEEIYLSIKAQKPLFIIGAFGGASKDAIDALMGKEPERLNESWQLKKKELRENAEYFNTHKPSSEKAIDYSSLINFLNEKGVTSLNNGLDEEENKRLFKTKHIPEMVSLILKGLTRTTISHE